MLWCCHCFYGFISYCGTSTARVHGGLRLNQSPCWSDGASSAAPPRAPSPPPTPRAPAARRRGRVGIQCCKLSLPPRGHERGDAAAQELRQPQCAVGSWKRRGGGRGDTSGDARGLMGAGRCWHRPRWRTCRTRSRLCGGWGRGRIEQCSTAHASALERGGGAAAKWEL